MAAVLALQGNCFEIGYRNKKPGLIPVYHFNELTLAYFNSCNEIIILKGIYNFKEDETYFSEHRFAVMKYNNINGKFRESNLGNTKFKYSGFDENDSAKKALLEIKKKEKLLAGKLNISG